MIDTFKVGLTGGIACGKTSACKIFQNLGIPVIDADEISRELTAPGSPLLPEIKTIFGKTILDEHGALKRSALRTLVFADNSALAKLNALLHPAIHRELILRAKTAGTHAPYVVLAIPLLFEHHLEKMCQRILTLDCSEKLQLERILRRDGSSLNTARSIIRHQVPRSERLTKADDIIDTESGDLQKLECAVKALHEKYLQLAAQFAAADTATRQQAVSEA